MQGRHPAFSRFCAVNSWLLTNKNGFIYCSTDEIAGQSARYYSIPLHRHPYPVVDQLIQDLRRDFDGQIKGLLASNRTSLYFQLVLKHCRQASFLMDPRFSSILRHYFMHPDPDASAFWMDVCRTGNINRLQGKRPLDGAEDSPLACLADLGCCRPLT